MKRKGFTLIELLAVIVILAVIALIAVPTILNIINNAQKSAFKDSVYGIIESGEMYYSNQMMETDGMTEVKTFTFPEAVGLEIKGSKPTSGTMVITKEGRIGLAVSNGKYCAKKGQAQEDLTIDGNVDNCIIPIITSKNNCIKDIESSCENGTEVQVQVNDNDNYTFYVIKDTGNELTLIMDRNLKGRVTWISKTDYINAGGLESNYGPSGNNNKGPITALNYLERETSNWINVSEMSYTLSDDSGNNVYQSIIRTKVRARILTKTEIINLGCTGVIGVCPNYLYTNLKKETEDSEPSGYWLSSAFIMNSVAQYINYYGNLNATTITDADIGVRPVVTLSKGI